MEVLARIAPEGHLLLSGLRFHEDRRVVAALGLEPRRARLSQGWWGLEF